MDPATIMTFGGMLLLSITTLIISICEMKNEKKSTQETTKDIIDTIQEARSLIISTMGIITFSIILISNMLM